MSALLRDSVQLEQEEHVELKQAVDQSIDGICITGIDLEVRFVNPAWSRMHGYEVEELLGKPMEVFHTEEQLREDLMPFIDWILAGRAHQGEVGHVRRDGTEFPTLMSVSALRDEHDEPFGFVGVARDITQQKETQVRMVRGERLRALGEMSAGVSHNLNNLLTGVTGPLSLLEELPLGEEALREVRRIRTAAVRAADLVRRLHSAVRVESEQMGPVDLSDAVAEALATSRPRWKDEPESKSIKIEVSVQTEDVPPVQANASGLQDVLINLIFNAVDAMPEGGQIEIVANRREEGIQLRFLDTGVGMDEERSVGCSSHFLRPRQTWGRGSVLPPCTGRWPDGTAPSMWRAYRVKARPSSSLFRSGDPHRRWRRHNVARPIREPVVS